MRGAGGVPDRPARLGTAGSRSGATNPAVGGGNGGRAGAACTERARKEKSSAMASPSAARDIRRVLAVSTGGAGGGPRARGAT